MDVIKEVKNQINVVLGELFVKHYGKKSVKLKNTACDKWSSEGEFCFWGEDKEGNFLSITEVDEKSNFRVFLSSTYSDVENVKVVVDYPTIIDILTCSINKDVSGLTSLIKQLSKKEGFNSIVEYLEA